MTENNPVGAVSALLHRYIELFNAGDFKTAVDSYYLPFSWLVGPAISTAFTADEFVTKMNAMRGGLVEQGFERSELTSCTVRMLGEQAALADVEVARHFKGGRVEMTGGTYVVYKNGDNWKLTNIIGHPLDEIVGKAKQE